MKALMSMFVEIMGLQMNTDKLNQNPPLPRLPLEGVTPNPQAQELWKTDRQDEASADPADLLAALELGPPLVLCKNEDDGDHKKDKKNKEEPTKATPAVEPLAAQKTDSATDGDDNDNESSTNASNKEEPEPTYTERVPGVAEDEEEWMPTLEDIPLADKKVQQNTAAKSTVSSSSKDSPIHENIVKLGQTSYQLKEEDERSGIVCGIAVPEWETLERMAMEDALEQEERARKACTAAKRKVWRPLSGTARALDSAAFLDYGNNADAMRSPFFPFGSSKFGPNGNGMTDPAAALKEIDNKAAEEAQRSAAWEKQRLKRCTAWRNKVVAACQSSDVPALTSALEEECPLKPEDKASHWMSIIPHVLPKQRMPFGKKQSAGGTRGKLLNFLLNFKDVDASWFLEPDERSGRSALHIACWLGDTETVKAILNFAKKLRSKSGKKKSKSIPGLDEPCQESGWPSLLYAAVGGSCRCVELLLQEGALPSQKTSDVHTWLKSSGNGATVLQYLQFCSSGRLSSQVESHGVAMEELEAQLNKDEPLKRQYSVAWSLILGRLQIAGTGGNFQSLEEKKLKEYEKKIDKAAAEVKEKSSEDTVSSNSTKQSGKKSKKKGDGDQKHASRPSEAVVNPNQESKTPAVKKPTLESDPLTVMLIEMGFEKDPVIEGIKALGGPNKATPDTVIAWMLDNPQNQQEQDFVPARAVPEPRVTSLPAPAPTAPRSRGGAAARKQQPQQSKGRASAKNEKQKKQEEQKQIQLQRKQEEERLQAKREEQRRRNREWNRKQEASTAAQAKVAPKAPQPAAPAMQTLPPVPPLQASALPSIPAGITAPPKGPPAVISAQMGTSDGVSTVASSDLFNDDATIATIESRNTFTHQPALLQGFPLAAPAQVPPGFNGLNAGLGTSSSGMENPEGQRLSNRPPGIPEESHTLLGDAANNLQLGNAHHHQPLTMQQSQTLVSPTHSTNIGGFGATENLLAGVGSGMVNLPGLGAAPTHPGVSFHQPASTSNPLESPQSHLKYNTAGPEPASTMFASNNDHGGPPANATHGLLGMPSLAGNDLNNAGLLGSASPSVPVNNASLFGGVSSADPSPGLGLHYGSQQHHGPRSSAHLDNGLGATSPFHLPQGTPGPTAGSGPPGSSPHHAPGLLMGSIGLGSESNARNDSLWGAGPTESTPHGESFLLGNVIPDDSRESFLFNGRGPGTANPNANHNNIDKPPAGFSWGGETKNQHGASTKNSDSGGAQQHTSIW